MSGDKIAHYASQLKYVEIGSAFMPKVEKEKLMTWLPNTKICMHYGLTEASRSAFIDFHADGGHLESIGKSSPNTTVEIFDEAGNLVQSGQEGELCVKGEHVCSGYWGWMRILLEMISMAITLKLETGDILIIRDIYI